jgi:hypothetical protein
MGVGVRGRACACVYVWMKKTARWPDSTKKSRVMQVSKVALAYRHDAA